MEEKEFEKFYSLCERTVSRQRLLGADDKDIAFVLTGMMATLPEDELTLPRHKKLVDLVVNKEESQEKTAIILTEKEFQEYLQEERETIAVLCGKGSRADKYMRLIGRALCGSPGMAYTREQLRRLVALADE
jgi:hypothetical protein